MVASHSLWMYFSQAGIVVKTVMFILFAASVASWTVIVQRALYLRQTRAEYRAFEDEFWSGTDLTELYLKLNSQDDVHEGMTGIFYVGFREYIRLKKQKDTSKQELVDGVKRAMHIAYSKEVDQMEQSLPFLASVGSISPYIGLFGTVWGIMASLQSLSGMQQATIAMVAPGISEALVATAMGLFAAIPAWLAYNRYISQVDRICNDFERFQNELATILQRQSAS